MKVDKQKIEALTKEIKDITEAKKLVASVRKSVKQARKLEKHAEKFGCLILLVLYHRGNEQKLQQYLPKLRELVEAIEPYSNFIRSKSLLYELYHIYLDLRKEIEEVQARIERASS